MDSKGKKIGILIVLCTLLVVMAAVVVVNYKRFMGGDSKAANEKGAMSASGQMIEPDGRVHGVDLSAFLKDSSFLTLRHQIIPARLHMMRLMKMGNLCAI